MIVMMGWPSRISLCDANSELKKSGLFSSIECCIVSDQIIQSYVNHVFSTLFWLQSEHRQKFVPSFVWIQRYFKVDMSIL